MRGKGFISLVQALITFGAELGADAKAPVGTPNLMEGSPLEAGADAQCTRRHSLCPCHFMNLDAGEFITPLSNFRCRIEADAKAPVGTPT